MSDFKHTVSIRAARNLTTTHKTGPTMLAQSPRYLLKLLPWIDVPGGTYRINQTRLAVRGRGRIDFDYTDAGPRIEPEALQAIPLFRYMPGSILGLMLMNLRPLQVERGGVIIEEGKDRDTLFLLLNGHVEEIQTGSRGEELVVNVLGPGDYFGENELALDQGASSTIRATTSCFLMILEKQALEQALAAAGLTDQFRDAIARRLQREQAGNEYGEKPIAMAADTIGEAEVPATYVDFYETPRELGLSLIQTVLRIHTRVADLYNNPMNQLQVQMFVTAMYMYERQEWELINNPHYGLLSQCAPSMRLRPRLGTPTPDDLDAMLARVWKQPSFFLMHPRAIEAFLRECTWRGVPPPTVEMHGGKFVTWRGVPLVPTEKLEVNGRTVARSGPGKTHVILVRAGGEREHGVAGLHQTGVAGEVAPGLSVRLMGIDQSAIASYLMTLYFSLAIHAEDAVCVMEDVEVGFHHDYSVPPAGTPEPAGKPEPVVKPEPAPPARNKLPWWERFCGGVTDLVCSTHTDGRLVVAVRGMDAALWINSQTAPGYATWTGWSSLGGAIKGRPTLATHADGRLFAGVIGLDDQLLTLQQQGPDSADYGPPAPRPGAALVDIAAVRDGGGKIIVFGRGADGRLWHQRQLAPNRDEWSEWEDLGGALDGPPVVLAGEEGRLAVFARGKGGDLCCIHRSADGLKWQDWQSLGGQLEGVPSVVRTADGHVHALARGADGALWRAEQTDPSDAFGGLESLGKADIGSVAEPAAITGADGRLLVFARGADGSSWRCEQVAPGGALGPWTRLSGSIGALLPARNVDGRIELFFLGSDGSVWHILESAPGEWA